MSAKTLNYEPRPQIVYKLPRPLGNKVKDLLGQRLAYCDISNGANNEDYSSESRHNDDENLYANDHYQDVNNKKGYNVYKKMRQER